MHHWVRQVIELVQFSTCPYVAFLIPIGFKDASQPRDETVGPNIEFPFVVKEQVSQILLYDIGVFFILKNATYLFERPSNFDTLSSVGILAWLDDPHVAQLFPLPFSKNCLKLLELSILLCSHVKSQRYVPVVLRYFVESVVVDHVFQQSFLISKKVILLEMIVHPLVFFQFLHWLFV